MKKILITGGAGFIGSNLVERLNSQGFTCTVLDSLTEQVHGVNPERDSFTFPQIKGKCEFYKGDIRDRGLLKKLLPKSDVVVHLASETGTGQSMYAVSNYCDVNVQGTAILLEEILKLEKKPEKIIVASSRAIYGEGRYKCSEHSFVFPEIRTNEDMQKGVFDPLCPQCRAPLKLLATTEDSAKAPKSIYGVTKLTQEQMVLLSAESAGISAFALRFQNVYGPGQSLSNPYTGILSIFSTRARSNKSINVFEDGEESRDFVFISDVVESIFLAIKSPHKKCMALNVGSGVSTSVNKVVKEIIEFFSSKSEVSVSGQYRIGDIRHNFADLTKVRQSLGFEPRVTFEEGIRKFLAWASEQETVKDAYESSLGELRQRGLLK